MAENHDEGGNSCKYWLVEVGECYNTEPGGIKDVAL